MDWQRSCDTMAIVSQGRAVLGLAGVMVTLINQIISKSRAVAESAWDCGGGR